MATLEARANLPPSGHLKGHFGHLTTEEKLAFDQFKNRCEVEGLLRDDNTSYEGDLKEGIYDDGSLLCVFLVRVSIVRSIAIRSAGLNLM